MSTNEIIKEFINENRVISINLFNKNLDDMIAKIKFNTIINIATKIKKLIFLSIKIIN